jgi:hypothetical protein
LERRALLLGAERMGESSRAIYGEVVVCIGKRTIVILPHKEVDLGNIKDDELIITAERQTPFGTELDALKIHKDDPRAKALASQQWNIGQKMGEAL